MRILICGSRDFRHPDVFEKIFRGTVCQEDTVIHGDCKTGADKMADILGQDFCEVLSFPANWNKFGKSAGYLRNEQMLKESNPDVVFAFLNEKLTPGTSNMISLSKKAGVKVVTIFAE